jgi:hypothetical protein
MTTNTEQSAAIATQAIARYGVRFGRSRDLIGADTFAEASAVVDRATRVHEQAGLHPDSFPRVTVIDLATQKVVATVSWNATVWAPGRWRPGAVPIYDPAAGRRS